MVRLSSVEHSDTTSEVQVQSTYQASNVEPSAKPTARKPCRSKKKCPVCAKRVIHLPRHLRETHEWTGGDSQRAVNLFGLRKPHETSRRKTSTKSRDYHYRRLCPVSGCGTGLKRLPSHLRHVHGISSISPVYTKLLQKAKTDTRDRKLRLRHGLDLSESLLEDIRNSVDSGEEMSEVPQKRPETECNLADLTCHRVENAEKSSPIVQREWTDYRYKYANTNVVGSAERSDKPSEVQVQSTYQASTLDPSGTRTRRTAGRLARSKKCPACVERVINLPRHLRGKHRWTVEDSRRVVHQFGLRKPYETSHRKTIQKFRDYHRHRLCPINGCNAVVKRLSPHLRQVHGISSVSPLYTKLLQKAKAETRDRKL